jgi:hypothetical protein
MISSDGHRGGALQENNSQNLRVLRIIIQAQRGLPNSTLASLTEAAASYCSPTEQSASWRACCRCRYCCRCQSQVTAGHNQRARRPNQPPTLAE